MRSGRGCARPPGPAAPARPGRPRQGAPGRARAAVRTGAGLPWQARARPAPHSFPAPPRLRAARPGTETRPPVRGRRLAARRRAGTAAAPARRTRRQRSDGAGSAAHGRPTAASPGGRAAFARRRPAAGGWRRRGRRPSAPDSLPSAMRAPRRCRSAGCAAWHPRRLPRCAARPGCSSRHCAPPAPPPRRNGSRSAAAAGGHWPGQASGCTGRCGGPVRDAGRTAPAARRRRAGRV
jgi:hypothetical protein